MAVAATAVSTGKNSAKIFELSVNMKCSILKALEDEKTDLEKEKQEYKEKERKLRDKRKMVKEEKKTILESVNRLAWAQKKFEEKFREMEEYAQVC